MDLNWLTISQAHAGLKAKQFSSEELTRACFDQIKKTENLNTFITLTEGLAIEQANGVDAKIGAGESIGILEGIPMAIKDLFNTKGIRSTSASRMLENFVPPYESTVTAKLKKEGSVVLGKTNLDEFACGTSTERSYFGPSLNPWNPKCVPGGSSGGSTAAVAAGQAFYALGTDTGGSIRQPASLSGCVGLKVTYGRVSRFGVTAMASSWDTIGHFARTVEDTALVLQAIAGHDPYDGTTPDVAVPDYSANLAKGVRGLKIGIPNEYFGAGVDDQVRTKVWEAIEWYRENGAIVKPVDMPLTKYGVAVYYVTMPGELSTNLERYDGIRFGHKVEGLEPNDLIEYYKANRGEGFGTEMKRRIMVGTFVLSAGYADAYYKHAQKVRTLIIQEFADTFKEVDVLMAPTSPTVAFELGSKINDPLAMYLLDALTIPASAAGIPGISIPCGFSSSGLPIGLQILGPLWGEPVILQAAAAYEQAHEWKDKHPTF